MKLKKLEGVLAGDVNGSVEVVVRDHESNRIKIDCTMILTDAFEIFGDYKVLSIYSYDGLVIELKHRSKDQGDDKNET
jgi:hypothetical protein